MATLQKTLNFEGSPSELALSNISLNFKVPVFEFNTKIINGKPFIVRDQLGLQTIIISRKLTDTSYEAAVKNEYLIGNSYASIINFVGHMDRIGFTHTEAGLLDSLSAEILVLITDKNKSLAGQASMQVLYSLSTSSAKYKEIKEQQAILNRSVSVNSDAADKLEQELAEYVRKNIFLINKDVFTEAAAQFRAAEPQFNEHAFLYIISHVTDLSSGLPKIKIDEEEIRIFLKTYFTIDNANRVKAVLRLIKDNLYDFPVTVPEIKIMEVKGTFKIENGEDIITLNEFSFYTLSVAYTIEIPSNSSRPISVTFDWRSLDASQINNNTVSFSFEPVISNLINSQIRVRVTGYDGSEVWLREYHPASEDLQNVKIEVPLLKPVVLSPSEEPKPVSSHKKLTGKIIEMSGKCKIKDVTVVIQAKKEGDTIWRIVGAATTDASGNFSLPYPYGIYIAAQALVSLTPNSPADIPVYNDSENIDSNETIADDFLYLLLQDADCSTQNYIAEDDCGCQDEKKSNRLPSQEDLLTSDSYTQDIGGSCMNLSTPNRTLNEYSVFAMVRLHDPGVANYILTKDVNGNLKLEGGLTKIARRPVDLSNPIYWQDAPEDHNNLSFYQAVNVATGHILHYKVVTKADGYSLGELLYSLPLAPGQKKQIVMFEQSHTLKGSESQRISQRESLAASLVNDVAITDTIVGNISESTSGSSSATTGGVSGGFGLGAIINAIGISLGVSGGVANANSSATQNSSRNIAGNFHERLRNSITQSAQSYREMNATVITTVEEGQNYGVTSEVIANHNHCHSLTMMYFEVLRHYAIYQELSHVEECLFVPLLMTDFTRENVYKWKDVLAKHLIPVPSDTYLQPFTLIKSGRQHPLLRGFDAIERIKINYENVDFPSGAYNDEVINFVTGEMYIQTNLPRPKTIFDRVKSWPIIEKEEGSNWSWTGAVVGAVLAGPLGAVAGGILAADGITIKQEAQKIINEYITIDANYRSVPPSRSIRVIKFDSHFFENGGLDKTQWIAYSKLLNMASEYVMLSYYFKDRLIAEWDNIFYEDIAPVLFQRIVEKIKIGTFSSLDFSSDRKYKGGNALMKINLRGSGANKKRKEIDKLKVELNNSTGLTNDLITLNVTRLTIRYSTSHYNGVLYSGGLGNDDLIDGTEIFTPENANEKRNPRKEDLYIAKKLIEHLNSNLEYYNKWLWRELDKDRLFMLLDGFNIETYNDFGTPIGSRSLASVVKNELIGIAGNSLVMPVAPGYKIDRTFIVEQPIEGPAEEINLLEHYKPLTPISPYRISCQTFGVFGEAIQGACDSCEKVKDNTSQDWDKFKTDEPTSINPVTVPIPTVTDWKAAFKDFPTPIINIQNAPATPAPGAGLAAAGLMDILGKNDIFKDITGLDQNQKNAMQTYLSNQENAKAFAEMAKTLAMQGHNSENTNKIADSIRNSPELSDVEKAQLLKDHFGQMVDGGQTKKAEQDTIGKKNDPTAMQIAKDAESKGKPVKAETQDSEGNSQKVEVGAGSNTDILAEAKGHLPKLKQTSASTCWAVAATIMMSWKRGRTLTIEDVLTEAGDSYLEKFRMNDSLRASEKDGFIETLSMTGEPPASYPLRQYIDWINIYGPLWITTDASEDESFSPHARILFKITGTGNQDGTGTDFHFIDPDGGSEQKESFNQFLLKYEQAATDNPSENLLIQIVHFSDPKEIGEGSVNTPSKVNLTINWTGINNGDLDADVQIKSGTRLLGSGTGSGSVNIIVDWKDGYSITIIPRLNSASQYDPDKMYVKTTLYQKNRASKVNGDPASLPANIKLNVNRWNLIHVYNSWTNEGVVRSKAEDVMSKTFLGKNITINKLVEQRLDTTQADFDALSETELERIKLSILKIESRTMRTMTGTDGTFSNHSLGCAVDVSENMPTKQNHHFLASSEQRLLILVQEVVSEQVGGWNNFDIITDNGIKQLEASDHFTREFPKWLFMYANAFSPEPGDNDLTEIPLPNYYSKERLEKMITSLDVNYIVKDRLSPLFQTVIDFKDVLTTWVSGININGVWIKGMISMDRKFLEIMLNNGWTWGGDYKSLRKDYMHFEDIDAVTIIKTP